MRKLFQNNLNNNSCHSLKANPKMKFANHNFMEEKTAELL